jgi:tetratricopeptide (TPR) repeat protein
MAGRYDRAIEVAQELTIPSLRDLVYGRALLEQGKPAEALTRFSDGLRLNPDNAVARYYAARAAEGIGDFDRAISEYRYSIRADHAATDARLRLALLHEAESAYGLALTAARHRTTRGPSDLDLDTELAFFRIAARAGRVAEARSRLTELAGRPGVWGRAVAAVADGIRARQGPAAAAQRVREAPGLDLSEPRNAEALRGLVIDLAETGEADAARAYLDAALAAHPDAAAFHEIRGFALERLGAPPEEVRAAYERAAELDPENALALAGLGRMAADSEAALGFYTRAAAADPEDPAPQRASAELLVALGKREEAEQTLLVLLDEHPYDAGIALRLAELLLARGSDTESALQLAKRAARFGGGPQAYELLGRVHRQRGEIDLAEEAASEAEAIRSSAAHENADPDA